MAILFGTPQADNFFEAPGDDLLFGLAGDDLIYGTSGNDIIFAGTGNDFLAGDDLGSEPGHDLLFGGTGNDTLAGGGAHDVLIGGIGDDSLDGAGNLSGAANLGKGEIDVLIAGSGRDRFILGGGSSRGYGPYYDDGNPKTAGLNDFALITDFNPQEDVISLIRHTNLQPKSEINYKLGAAPSGLLSGTGIFVDTGTEPNELIAILQDISPASMSLDAPYFEFFG